MSKKIVWRVLVGTFALMSFTAFAAGDAPTPMVELPALERPVVTLSINKGEEVIVPQESIVTRGGAPGVFVLAKDGEARFRMVKVGKSGKKGMQILSGLQGNETLVVGDLQTVYDGSPIKTSDNR